MYVNIDLKAVHVVILYATCEGLIWVCNYLHELIGQCPCNGSYAIHIAHTNFYQEIDLTNLATGNCTSSTCK